MSISEIKKMTASHIEAVEKIEIECFSVPWSEFALREELTNPLARFFVLEEDGQVVGYIGSHNVLGEVYITNVAVLKNQRGNGYGEALVRFLVNEMNKENADFVTLEVRKSNETAISLYEKTGFQQVGYRKGFYEQPKEDGILMTYYFNKG